MAAGCFIITTPNSGSIVEDGVHGYIVKTGDIDGLKIAISKALENPLYIKEIGEKNKKLINDEYRQVNYIERMISIYNNIYINHSK
jgi:glycosyltransferase involved in cell wall biosynthesis